MDYNVVMKKIRLTVLVACLVTVLALIFAVGLYIYIDYVNPQISAKVVSIFVLGMAVLFFITVNAVSLINKRNSEGMVVYDQEVRNDMVLNEKIIQTLSRKYNAVYYTDLLSGEVRFLQIGSRVSSAMADTYKEKHTLEYYAKAYAERLLAEKDREKFLKEVNTINLAEKMKNQEVYTFNYDATKDNKILHFQMKAMKVDGDPSKLVVGFEDVGYELEEAMNRNKLLSASLSQVATANQAKNLFLRNMSHEMRTPLNAILGYADIISKTAEATDTIKQDAETIIEQSNSLLKMIDDLLYVGKIHNGELTVHSSIKRLDVAAKGLYEDAQKIADDKGVPIVFLDRITSRDVICDFKMLKMAVMHVIENAIKYSDKGEIVRVLLREEECSEPDKILMILNVEDKGVGMDSEQLDKIFDPFEREKQLASQDMHNSGIGLMVTKAIIEMMHGTINITSEKGVGTTVEIRFILQKYVEKAKEDESEEN